MPRVKRKEITDKEKQEIEAFVRDEYEKGRPMFAVRERVKKQFGQFDWLTLLKVLMDIFFKIWK